MLPSLSKLSLAPTGAKDDVVTEIMDERQDAVVEGLRRRFAAEASKKRAVEAQEAELRAARVEAAQAARAAAWAAAAAAAADDTSGDENDDESLNRRTERRAPRSPPIHILEPGPFSVIVEALVNRLAPNAEAVKGSDADAMCRDVANVCRELATLNRLPGQAVDPKYDCSDPNAEIWRLAHAIFGVDPMGKLWLRGKGPNRLSWKANFVLLCKAFRPDFDYPKITWEAAHGGGIKHGFFSVWNRLWRLFPENTRAAREWEEAKFEEDAREAFLDEGDEDFDSDDSDYDEEAAFESYKERFEESEYYEPQLHSPEPEELKALRAKIRLPIKPGSAQIKWRVDNMKRLRLALNKGELYDGDEPEERRMYEDEQVAHRELLPKVEALQRLFKTLRRQARAMQNAAS